MFDTTIASFVLEDDSAMPNDDPLYSTLEDMSAFLRYSSKSFGIYRIVEVEPDSPDISHQMICYYDSLLMGARMVIRTHRTVRELSSRAYVVW